MEKSNAVVKVDTEENWNKAVNYIPDCFTILIYTYKNDSPKVKIGDGVHKISELPFLARQAYISTDENSLVL